MHTSTTSAIKIDVLNVRAQSMHTYVCTRISGFCCCVALKKKKKKRIGNQAAAWCIETDGQALRSNFLDDHHLQHALPSFLLQGVA